MGVIMTLRLLASIYNDYSQMQTQDSLMHAIRVAAALAGSETDSIASGVSGPFTNSTVL